MEIEPADLPEPLRRQMLEQIRNAMSSREYDQLLRAVGEDGVLKLALGSIQQAAGSRTSDTRSRTPEERRKKIWDGVKAAVGVLLLATLVVAMFTSYSDLAFGLFVLLVVGLAFLALPAEGKVLVILSSVVLGAVGALIGALVGGRQGALVGGVIGAMVPGIVLYCWALF